MDRKELAIKFAKSLDYPEIRKIILYGSVVREEDTEDSDIDILVITDNRKEIEDRVYSQVANILLEMEGYVSAKILTNDDYNRVKHTHFISTIEKEGIVIGW